MLNFSSRPVFCIAHWRLLITETHIPGLVTYKFSLTPTDFKLLMSNLLEQTRPFHFKKKCKNQLYMYIFILSVLTL